MNRLAQVIAAYNERVDGTAEEPMTQARLARLVGIHEMTVHRHATDKTSIDLAQAIAYADVLHCDVRELVESAS